MGQVCVAICSRTLRFDIDGLGRAIAPVALHHMNGILSHHLVWVIVDIFHAVVSVCP